MIRDICLILRLPLDIVKTIYLTFQYPISTMLVLPKILANVNGDTHRALLRKVFCWLRLVVRFAYLPILGLLVRVVCMCANSVMTSILFGTLVSLAMLCLAVMLWLDTLVYAACAIWLLGMPVGHYLANRFYPAETYARFLARSRAQRYGLYCPTGSLYEGIEPCERVKQLKHMLNRLGCMSDIDAHCEATVFNGATKRGVQAFQEKRGMEKTGVADPDTYAAITKAWEEYEAWFQTLVRRQAGGQENTCEQTE